MQFLYRLSLLCLLVAATALSSPSLLLAQGKNKKKDVAQDVTPAKMTTDIPAAQAFYDQAMVQAQNKQYEEAIRNYRAALKTDPAFLLALDQMAVTFRQSGQTDSAAHFLRLSTATNPNSLTAHQELATLLLAQKDYAGALREYQEMVRIAPDNPVGYAGAAKTLFLGENFSGSLNNGKKALELLKKAKAPDAEMAETQYFVGMAFFYTDSRENAKLYLKRAKANGVAVPKDLQQELNIK